MSNEFTPQARAMADDNYGIPIGLGDWPEPEGGLDVDRTEELRRITEFASRIEVIPGLVYTAKKMAE